MVDHDNVRAAADFANSVHRRDAKAEFERWGLSEAAIAELLEKSFLKPDALADGERDDALTESYMQRELTPATFREIWNYRRR